MRKYTPALEDNIDYKNLRVIIEDINPENNIGITIEDIRNGNKTNMSSKWNKSYPTF